MMHTCFSFHSFCELKYTWQKLFFIVDVINFAAYAEQTFATQKSKAAFCRTK